MPNKTETFPVTIDASELAKHSKMMNTASECLAKLLGNPEYLIEDPKKKMERRTLLRKAGDDLLAFRMWLTDEVVKAQKKYRRELLNAK